MAGYNPYAQYPYATPTWMQSTNQQFQYPQVNQQHDQQFVKGRAGAEAYQLPPGVMKQILWDLDDDRFYIKGYDETGRPRILADNDFQPHTEPEPRNEQPVQMQNYATKDDVKAINDRLSKMSGYVTLEQLNQLIGSLSVGKGGRIVMDNGNDV